MDNHNWLAEQFEANRSHLQSVAYRILGSSSEADDAVQESWFRLIRTEMDKVENIRAWLTTVVSRVCLDMLRAKKTLRKKSIEVYVNEQLNREEVGRNPEHEVLLNDSLEFAMMVVLETLNPAERIAFVLHDIFGVSFSDIAPIVDRSEMATRKMASRARRRLRVADSSSSANINVQRNLVESFLTAARNGDFEALLEVLAPDVVLRDDRVTGTNSEIRGAQTVAEKVMWGRASAAYSAIVNGNLGIVVAPGGKLLLVLVLTYSEEKIVEFNVITDINVMKQLDLILLNI